MSGAFVAVSIGVLKANGGGGWPFDGIATRQGAILFEFDDWSGLTILRRSAHH